MACIEARGLRKGVWNNCRPRWHRSSGGRRPVLGLIGPNGAGKTAALHSILGLTPCNGELKVLGRNPWTRRQEPEGADPWKVQQPDTRVRRPITGGLPSHDAERGRASGPSAWLVSVRLLEFD
jgi:hypothetical protein